MADVASAIRAGYYTVGLAGGVEAMSQTPMAWEGGVNPKIGNNKKAQSCLMPMGMRYVTLARYSWLCIYEAKYHALPISNLRLARGFKAQGTSVAKV